jgi:TolB-like protein
VTYVFGDFELDPARVELRVGGVAATIEPQVFALLMLLIENRDRMVSKDEIVAHVWNGRFISDAAIASRIKSARQALGDDGRTQRYIRTIHGQGFRFLADVSERKAVEIIRPEPQQATPASKDIRPRIAVLPFRLLGDAGPHYVIAEALPQDLITALSRLHWLFVIARASSFRFRGAEQDLANVRDQLRVRYLLTGAIEVLGGAMTVSVELSDAGDEGVIWSDSFRCPLAAAHEVREEIVQRVIAALEFQISLKEAHRAQLKAPGSLDAWSAYHLGLQHMFRFTRDDNAAATRYFAQAAAQEPDFARAYAGLSFTHFQNAFLRYTENNEDAARLARRYAEQCVERDPADPFGNLTMGRAHWLNGDLDASLPWLERASTLNPNYAQALYSRAWSLALLGEADASQADAEAALALSPLDPLRYGMLGVRAFAHLVRDERADAAYWADKAAHSPGAHALIEMIAVAAHELNGAHAQAERWAASARTRAPSFTHRDFLRAFPFRDSALCATIAKALARHSF